MRSIIKKAIVLLSALTLGAGMTSCASKPAGKYYALSNSLTFGVDPKLSSDIDRWLEECEDKVRADEKNLACTISFDGSNFKLYDAVMTGADEYSYSGTFSLKGSGLRFDFKQRTFKGKAIEYTKDPNGIQEKAICEQLKKMNDNGGFPISVKPVGSKIDRYDYKYLPLLRANSGITVNYETAETLKPIEDLLCVDTYGFELNGKYKKGNAFTIMYDPTVAPAKDPSSNCLGKENKDALETRKTYLENIFGGTKTKIEFQDGDWTWYDAQDKQIAKGIYSESEKHPGMIAMGYRNMDSAIMKTALPLVFYIAADGTIYYPGFVKIS